MGEHGMTPWRAGCAETCTSGSEGGSRKRTRRKPRTAPRPDPYTYVETLEGYLFLAVVMDMWSRKIVGWSMRDDLKAELVVDALAMAVTRRRPPAGLVHHSDRGNQPDEYERRCQKRLQERRQQEQPSPLVSTETGQAPTDEPRGLLLATSGDFEMAIDTLCSGHDCLDGFGGACAGVVQIASAHDSTDDSRNRQLHFNTPYDGGRPRVPEPSRRRDHEAT
jgi:hypothetical protein